MAWTDASGLGLGDLQPAPLVADGEVVGDGAPESLGEEPLEIEPFGELTMDVARVGRLYGEAFVPERDVDLL